jgi:hypothetical protein
LVPKLIKRGEDKSLPSQQLLLSRHASTCPTHAANRKSQHLLGMVHAKNAKKLPNHAHLSSNSVYLTTQAWLLDCHPRD